MFCSKCGSYLEDTARFCDKCGTPTGAGEVNNYIVKEKKVDNEVRFVVKPKFKALYFMIGAIIGAIVSSFFIVLPFGIMGEAGMALIIALVFSFIILGSSAISMLFKKMQIKNMEYSFYNTKIVYTDSFLNQTEKEVKYKYIRECVLTRTITDRIFGFGRIVLYTNAESGYGNGIVIPFLENSSEVYRQIKDLLDE